jgi:hypothetical protein
MWNKATRIAVVMGALLASGVAAADDKAPATQPSKPTAPATQPSKPAPSPAPAPAPAPADGAASADVKAGTGVEAKVIVGEATEFTAGTKVWIWSQVRGANGTTVKHVWKKGGAEVWAANLKVKSNRWSTYSRGSGCGTGVGGLSRHGGRLPSAMLPRPQPFRRHRRGAGRRVRRGCERPGGGRPVVRARRLRIVPHRGGGAGADRPGSARQGVSRL